MAAATFTQLPRELRDMIWSAAALAQYQQSVNFSIADGQPASCVSPFGERLRQAFIGYENLPHDTEKQPLRVYVHDSPNRDRLRLGVNELQTLVNRLPMATVCSEARSHAIAFCQARVEPLNLFYIVDTPGEPEGVGAEILEPIVASQTTVMVTNAYDRKFGPKGFDSANHLIDVVDRVFGSCVERIISSSWLRNFNSLEEIYWPHSAQILELEDITPTFEGDRGHGRPAVLMTPERIAYQTDEFMDQTGGFGLLYVAQHLLKFYEIVDASAQRLPRLQGIELELHTRCWDEVITTRIKATIEKGGIWVNWDDVELNFYHRFDGFDGMIPLSDDSD